jgi:hypothetical protein
MVVPKLRCRQIDQSDIAAVATLLARGLGRRNRRFWLRALEQLGSRNLPVSLPKYGYLLESGGTPVGAILLICSKMRTANMVVARCNVSSWYVAPDFRAYATLLVSQALRHKDVTYLNISPARHTWPIIEAQGFSRYCDGVFLALPMLNGPLGGEHIKVFDARRRPEVTFDPCEQEILSRHAAFGCISLWCATPEGAHPFVFRSQPIKAVIPCAQLIYCRDVADFVRFAGPIGRFLALRGHALVMIDANAPIPGLIGTFFRGRRPKYFRGPWRPRLGDLADTEIAILGV